jgi:hypothetical protein
MAPRMNSTIRKNLVMPTSAVLSAASSQSPSILGIWLGSTDAATLGCSQLN